MWSRKKLRKTNQNYQSKYFEKIRSEGQSLGGAFFVFDSVFSSSRIGEDKSLNGHNFSVTLSNCNL
jgi:hypothetical protein